MEFAPEFHEWPKTKRLFRDIVVTEKIDGTNSAIGITQLDWTDEITAPPADYVVVNIGDEAYAVYAQSRSRIIKPGKTTDNYGFASWVHANAAELVDVFGPGLHYGEWWGQGIQRRYGLDHKRFSLFNTARHFANPGAEIGGVPVGPVPVVYEGVFSEARIHHALMSLKIHGSHAAPGFPNPEGICVYHTQTRSVMKVTLDHNDAGKWEAAA
ncbi:RNA ligase family protein [Streptomyces scabiei]|uniref:RNA ligase family protein n=1 Tax=Streptomyces scabiei TaxID=1930 RepID=UPI0029AAB7DD|nr:RNA ligase family protein [Streptomyces scabiei]MDX2575913.1 RNA ligase family protein [Streptomyces scabiei]MDX2885614.1 RNA ligase family protein [Streptomyces scabiei]MDX2993433.1 RNA ligase family protein [Streptomyces scabiei]MDX3028453.1 RNA ligase family protein [Streptomyces scabiei]MDX3047213.1 RNA ligase family protein [Streptomyces scabiei]